MKVEILTFQGCPNAEATSDLTTRVIEELGIEAVVEHVDVRDPEAAVELRFLGSPTVRVDGRDIEPGADQRREYVFACRVYRTEQGPRGVPDERWLRGALTGA